MTEEITLLIQDEIVAEYEREPNALRIRLGNGQRFYVSVVEVE